MIVSNPNNKTVYFDVVNLRIYKDWREFITADSVAKASLQSHKKNSLNFVQNPDRYSPVIEGIFPIPPRTVWDFSANTFKLISPSRRILPTSREVSLEDLVHIFEKFTRRIDCKDIAIELSGGLDSSLIIALSKHVGIDPILIGFQSARWEFRTEKKIQDIYATQVSRSLLIDYESALPFCKLDLTPIHPLPSTSSLYYYGHKVIAESAYKLGARVILNGIGVEPFLVESFLDSDNNYLQKNSMEDSWPNDFVFTHLGCRYLNVARTSPVYNKLLSLRSGQGIDLQKKWARSHFKALLPIELSEYSYKAAFDGIFQAGLSKEFETIKDLFEVASEFTESPELKNYPIDFNIENSCQLNQEDNTNFLATLSYVSWVSSLLREKVI